MKYEYYDAYINKRTKGRYDISPIFADPVVFSRLIADLLKRFNSRKFDAIAGLDALGFILGGAAAYKLKKCFIPIRKSGKLPGIKGTVLNVSFMDYTKNIRGFEINRDSIKKGDKILIIDDWIETGAQVKSAIKLIEELGGIVVGVSALFAEKNSGTKVLFDGYNCKAIGIAESRK
jgi:adenine phosphoribosyltransferase